MFKRFMSVSIVVLTGLFLSACLDSSSENRAGSSEPYANNMNVGSTSSGGTSGIRVQCKLGYEKVIESELSVILIPGTEHTYDGYRYICNDPQSHLWTTVEEGTTDLTVGQRVIDGDTVYYCTNRTGSSIVGSEITMGVGVSRISGHTCSKAN